MLSRWVRDNKSALVRWKVRGSKAESAREFADWYSSKWRRDYPDLYESPMRIASALRRRPGRPLYANSRRRRLMVTGRSSRRKKQYAKIKAGWRADQEKLGERIGSDTGKRAIAATAVSPGDRLQNDTLYKIACIDIAQGTAPDERSRRMVNLRGIQITSAFHIDPDVEGNWNTEERPVFLHAALVHVKNHTIASSFSETDFFRNYGASKSTDFSSANWFQKTFNPLNSDALHVYFHKHWKLEKTSDRSSAGTKYKQIFFRKYVPIKRQIRFEGDAANTAHDNLFYLQWYTYADSTGGAIHTSGVLLHSYQVIQHFREPRNS